MVKLNHMMSKGHQSKDGKEYFSKKNLLVSQKSSLKRQSLTTKEGKETPNRGRRSKVMIKKMDLEPKTPQMEEKGKGKNYGIGIMTPDVRKIQSPMMSYVPINITMTSMMNGSPMMDNKQIPYSPYGISPYPPHHTSIRHHTTNHHITNQTTHNVMEGTPSPRGHMNHHIGMARPMAYPPYRLPPPPPPQLKKTPLKINKNIINKQKNKIRTIQETNKRTATNIILQAKRVAPYTPTSPTNTKLSPALHPSHIISNIYNNNYNTHKHSYYSKENHQKDHSTIIQNEKENIPPTRKLSTKSTSSKLSKSSTSSKKKSSSSKKKKRKSNRMDIPRIPVESDEAAERKKRCKKLDEISREELLDMTRNCTQSQAAKLLSCSISTLKRKYNEAFGGVRRWPTHKRHHRSMAVYVFDT